jgi:hypothetical protein
MNRFIVLFALLAALPIKSITVERKDGSKKTFGDAQSAIVDIQQPIDAVPAVVPVVVDPWYEKTDQGFTSFPLAPGAREYFVATNGNDANPGTLAQPLRTLQKAAALVRNNSGDRVRPLAGNVFFGQVEWGKSAPNGFYTGIIAYGDGERPRIETPTNAVHIGSAVKNAAFSGLNITCTSRNPNRPNDFVKPPLEMTGIDCRNAGSQNILVEDCKIEYFGNDLIFQPNKVGAYHSGIVLNRNIILNSFAPRIYGGQGNYSDFINGLTITENFYYHTGWMVAPGMVNLPPTQYRHANYVNKECTNVVARGNWFWSAASFGIQARGGATIEGNYFWDNGNHALTGGKSGAFRNNVVLGGHARAPSDGSPAVGGASGFSAQSSANDLSGNYFWGPQPGAIKYPNAAIEISRGPYTPAGAIAATIRNNGFVAWPDNKNYVTNSGQAQNVIGANGNFQSKIPDAAIVWPNQSRIDALANRPLHRWVKQFTPAQVYAEFQRANGR